MPAQGIEEENSVKLHEHVFAEIQLLKENLGKMHVMCLWS